MQHAAEMSEVHPEALGGGAVRPPFCLEFREGLLCGSGNNGWHVGGCLIDGRALSGWPRVRNQTKPDSMQAENQTNSDFSRRTNALAARLGLRLSDLTGVIGISKAMLFAYRSNQPISGKVWAKLKNAEDLAGSYDAGPDATKHLLQDDVTQYRTKSDPAPIPGIAEVMKALKAQVAPHVADEVERLLLEHQRERLRMEANDFFGNVEALAASAKQAAGIVTDKRIAKDLRTLSEAVAKLMPTVQTLVQSLTKPKP